MRPSKGDILLLPATPRSASESPVILASHLGATPL